MNEDAGHACGSSNTVIKRAAKKFRRSGNWCQQAVVDTTARSPLIIQSTLRFPHSNEVHRVADYARSTQRGEIPCTDLVATLSRLLFVATTNLAMNNLEVVVKMVDFFHQSRNIDFGPPTLKKQGRCGRGIKTHNTIVNFCQFRIQQSTVTVIIVCTLFSCAVTSDTMHFQRTFCEQSARGQRFCNFPLSACSRSRSVLWKLERLGFGFLCVATWIVGAGTRALKT